MSQLVAAITDGNVDRADVITLDNRSNRLTNIGLETIPLQMPKTRHNDAQHSG